MPCWLERCSAGKMVFCGLAWGIVACAMWQGFLAIWIITFFTGQHVLMFTKKFGCLLVLKDVWMFTSHLQPQCLDVLWQGLRQCGLRHVAGLCPPSQHFITDNKEASVEKLILQHFCSLLWSWYWEYKLERLGLRPWRTKARSGGSPSSAHPGPDARKSSRSRLSSISTLIHSLELNFTELKVEGRSIWRPSYISSWVSWCRETSRSRLTLTGFLELTFRLAAWPGLPPGWPPDSMGLTSRLSFRLNLDVLTF